MFKIWRNKHGLFVECHVHVYSKSRQRGDWVSGLLADATVKHANAYEQSSLSLIACLPFSSHMPFPGAPLIQPLGASLSLTCHQITHTKFTCIPRLSSCCRFVVENKSWSSWVSRSWASAASLIGGNRKRERERESTQEESDLSLIKSSYRWKRQQAWTISAVMHLGDPHTLLIICGHE